MLFFTLRSFRCLLNAFTCKMIWKFQIKCSISIYNTSNSYSSSSLTVGQIGFQSEEVERRGYVTTCIIKQSKCRPLSILCYFLYKSLIKVNHFTNTAFKNIFRPVTVTVIEQCTYILSILFLSKRNYVDKITVSFMNVISKEWRINYHTNKPVSCCSLVRNIFCPRVKIYDVTNFPVKQASQGQVICRE